MHRYGYIHRDIKPHNILFSPTGRTVLADVGLTDKAGSNGYIAPVLCGTTGYQAPEMINPALSGYDGVTTKADVWSLGACCFELACELQESPYCREARRYAASCGIVVDSTNPLGLQDCVEVVTCRIDPRALEGMAELDQDLRDLLSQVRPHISYVQIPC